MPTSPRTPRLQPDDDFPPPSAGKTVVIGCGSILRGDDAAGPVAVRRLWERGVPDDVLLVDGGTAGMDVAFKMDGAARVVIVDASATGAAPGTIHRVPAAELVDLPPVQGLHSHQFRWDHSLAFADWLLGDRLPADITVYLIEVTSCEPGAELTPPVDAAIDRVLDLITESWPAVGPGLVEVELTGDGYLRIDAPIAAAYFPADALVAMPRGRELWLLPLTGQEGGGLLMKRRNAGGDRSVLVHEHLPIDLDSWPVGPLSARWDGDAGALRVDLGVDPGRPCTGSVDLGAGR